MVSFVTQSSFVNQHLLLDQISKTSYLDIILLNASTKTGNSHTLYTSFINDTIVQTNVCFLPFSSLLQCEYQEAQSTAFLVAPEITFIINNYVLVYILPATFSNLPTGVFDSYINNLNYFPSEGLVSLMVFGLYIWFIVYFVTTNLSLK